MLGSAPPSSRRDRRAPISFGGVEQRRRTVDSARVEVGASAEKELDQRGLARLRRSAKRGCAVAVARVDRDAAIEKRARLSLAAEPCGGEQERSRLIFIALMQSLQGLSSVGAAVRRAR